MGGLYRPETLDIFPIRFLVSRSELRQIGWSQDLLCLCDFLLLPNSSWTVNTAQKSFRTIGILVFLFPVFTWKRAMQRSDKMKTTMEKVMELH